MPKTKVQLKPRFRVKVGDEIALGPGKIDLLEAVREAGSISRAAKDIGLSYKRAWDMVDAMNRLFKEPLVSRSAGGKGGGGATLTPLGERTIELYRRMETKTQKTVQAEWREIEKNLKK